MTKKISRTAARKTKAIKAVEPTAPAPVAGVVELCEALLTDANSGLLRALAVTFVPAGMAPSYRVVADHGDTLSPHLLNSGVALMVHGMGKAFDGASAAPTEAPAA